MKALTKYLKIRKNAIELLLKKPVRKYTLNTFHELRIEIKKLKALSGLINFGAKDFNQKKIFKPFRLIFHQAGKVRELQLEEIMLKKYFRDSLLKDYRENLRNQIIKEKKDFVLIANKELSLRLKKSYHKIMLFLLKIKKNKAKIYINKKQKKIDNLLSHQIIKTSHIHELRKKLKDFQYNLGFLEVSKRNKAASPKSILSELLGRWHDCQVIIRHLEKAIDTLGIDPKEVSQLEKIKATFFSKNQLLLDRINAVIP